MNGGLTGRHIKTIKNISEKKNMTWQQKNSTDGFVTVKNEKLAGVYINRR